MLFEYGQFGLGCVLGEILRIYLGLGITTYRQMWTKLTLQLRRLLKYRICETLTVGEEAPFSLHKMAPRSAVMFVF